ncbi:crotonase/enoyl-CoA hydratase family protein [Rhizobiaceae bacterium n13]|uniref:Crotonase/enoyl-CoA hydratase family protein n=1 Tax=Ferirhizobium litorale TaxID=2927786 RepID=A0AAE3QE37_9HYPH|nr:crotonase/enoyl-CoA hydratase family protein [Fererhizobium litorale]MDI7861798.1 crotonase/enoyl-CoA hydratase family protein [Fererhizobium litorale]MDI7921860.1 crotonase/enoyl-CoA hydratase family protein [Fererhizobium litorale]
MDFGTIKLATDARGVTTLTLDRPDQHNALSAELIADLTRAAAAIAGDPAIRVVVLTGAGASFCAGGDLGWMKAQMVATRDQRMAEARKLAHMLRALNTLPKPLIARVNGQAYGGGVGLISVCDVAISVSAARFGLTETRLGLIPATISPYVAARLGEATLRRLALSGRIFDASEAFHIGLVSAVVEPADLDRAVEREVAACLGAAPGAITSTKSLLRALGTRIDDEVIEMTIARLADTWETQEAEEGVAAFFDKRPPPWRKA